VRGTGSLWQENVGIRAAAAVPPNAITEFGLNRTRHFQHWRCIGGICGEHRGFMLQAEFENFATLSFNPSSVVHFGLGLFVPAA
jgi:hypothetical protein